MADVRAGGGGRPFRDAGVEIWLAPLDALAAPLTALEAADPLAPVGDLDGLNPTRSTARLLLRRLIARRFGRRVAAEPMMTGAHGKPSLLGLDGDFNLSHTVTDDGAVALIGLGCVAALGVDVEPQRTVRVDQRRRELIIRAAQDIAEGAPLPEEDGARILQAWARLEAWGKADGRGIGRTLTHFGVLARAEPGESIVGLSKRGALIAHDLAVGPQLFAAVALPDSEPAPAVRAMPADPAALLALLAPQDENAN